MQQLLVGYKATADLARKDGYLPVLVAHAMVAGSEVSTGQTLAGLTVELSPGDLANLGCEYVALGHIHKAQTWMDGRVAYSGSPLAMNYGEAEAKGYCVVQIGDNFSHAFVEGPAPPVVTLTVDWRADACTKPCPWALGSQYPKDTQLTVDGQRVRIQIQRTSDQPAVDRDQVQTMLETWGAVEVQVEVQTQHVQAIRSTKAIEARTPWALFQLWREATGRVDEDVVDEDALKQQLHDLMEEDLQEGGARCT